MVQDFAQRINHKISAKIFSSVLQTHSVPALKCLMTWCCEYTLISSSYYVPTQYTSTDVELIWCEILIQFVQLLQVVIDKRDNSCGWMCFVRSKQIMYYIIYVYTYIRQLYPLTCKAVTYQSSDIGEPPYYTDSFLPIPFNYKQNNWLDNSNGIWKSV